MERRWGYSQARSIAKDDSLKVQRVLVEEIAEPVTVLLHHLEVKVHGAPL